MDPGDLYGLALDGFVAARGELARALRADGRRDEAKAVTGLRKPSVAAWVVNQLVRARPRDLAELFAAGDAVRQAQAALVGGRGNRDALRRATDRERAAVAGLVETAGGLLSPTGVGPGAAVLDRVADTLHAAALDDAARAQVSDGMLAREVRYVGLGGAMPVEPGPAPPTKPGQMPPTNAGKAPPTKPERVAAAPDRRAERDRAARERAEAERRERERAGARRAARMAESAARRDLEQSQRALRHAHDLRDRAGQALAAAEADLAAAQERADAAAAAHRRATAELQDA